MAVCWLSARTCSLLPSSLCFSWCVSSRTLPTSAVVLLQLKTALLIIEANFDVG